MTANPTKCSFDICSEDSQSTLHDENETTVRFSTTINGIPCEARVLCTPCCHPHSHLTAHEVSWQSDPVTNNRAKHQLTLIEKPPNKYQKSLQGDRVHMDASAETAENFNHDAQNLHPSATPKQDVHLTWNSIDAVRESYRSAIRDDQLKCAREPQLPSGSDGSPWDPYIIAPTSVRHALLNKERVEMITKSVESTIKIVPKADEWLAKARERNLTPEDVRRILLTAFVQPFSKQQPEQDDKLPRTLKIIAEVLRRAEELKKHLALREEAVLRMTAYALMEVAIAAGEAAEAQLLALVVGHAKKWLKQSRYLVRSWCWAMANSLGWEGRDLPLFCMFVDKHGEPALRAFFQRTVPAIAGEFVFALSSEEYWRDLPATRSTGLIEVVMVLLDDCVNHETICSALGCSVSYREGLDPNPFSELCTEAAKLYQSKLFWKEMTGASGREDQTKTDGLDNNDPGLDNTNPGPDNTDPGLGLDNTNSGVGNTGLPFLDFLGYFETFLKHC